MVNALGRGKVEVGDEAWYKYHDRVNELVTQRDAYNMGRMGQLDGETAVSSSEQADASTRAGIYDRRREKKKRDEPANRREYRYKSNGFW